jgi:hypothetical protein
VGPGIVKDFPRVVLVAIPPRKLFLRLGVAKGRARPYDVGPVKFINMWHLSAVGRQRLVVCDANANCCETVSS